MSIKNCFKKEIENLTNLAEQGNVFAQSMLGLIYENEKAALQGYAPIQYNLGIRYYYGIGAPQNYELALEWFQKAALQGFAPAQHRVGIMYRYGYGVLQNYEKAFGFASKISRTRICSRSI